MSFSGETIWIVGASSGIGKALAHELHRQGAVLLLSARNKEQLDTLNSELGGHHRILPLDVSDYNQVTGAAKRISIVDRVIFMAAVYEPGSIKDMDMTFLRQLMDINFMGAVYLTKAVLPLFEKQQSGQLTFCTSVAGFTGLPDGQPYSASKAALINFAESLYAEAEDYMDVKIINPGFVRTPATDKNEFKMPMRIEPEAAAKAIARGLKRRGFEIHFPKRFTLMMKALSVLPYWLKLRLTKSFSG